MKHLIFHCLAFLLLCGCGKKQEPGQSASDNERQAKIETALGQAAINAKDYGAFNWGGRFTADRQRYVSNNPREVYFLTGRNPDVFSSKDGFVLRLDLDHPDVTKVAAKILLRLDCDATTLSFLNQTQEYDEIAVAFTITSIRPVQVTLSAEGTGNSEEGVADRFDVEDGDVVRGAVVKVGVFK